LVDKFLSLAEAISIYPVLHQPTTVFLPRELGFYVDDHVSFLFLLPL